MQQHYWRVTDAGFEKAMAGSAMQNPMQSEAVSSGSEEFDGELYAGAPEFPANREEN